MHRTPLSTLLCCGYSACYTCLWCHGSCTRFCFARRLRCLWWHWPGFSTLAAVLSLTMRRLRTAIFVIGLCSVHAHSSGAFLGSFVFLCLLNLFPLSTFCYDVSFHLIFLLKRLNLFRVGFQNYFLLFQIYQPRLLVPFHQFLIYFSLWSFLVYSKFLLFLSFLCFLTLIYFFHH